MIRIGAFSHFMTKQYYTFDFFKSNGILFDLNNIKRSLNVRTSCYIEPVKQYQISINLL